MRLGSIFFPKGNARGVLFRNRDLFYFPKIILLGFKQRFCMSRNRVKFNFWEIPWVVHQQILANLGFPSTNSAAVGGHENATPCRKQNPSPLTQEKPRTTLTRFCILSRCCVFMSRIHMPRFTIPGLGGRDFPCDNLQNMGCVFVVTHGNGFSKKKSKGLHTLSEDRDGRSGDQENCRFSPLCLCDVWPRNASCQAEIRLPKGPFRTCCRTCKVDLSEIGFPL